jgi:hypothetical protein
MAVRVWKGGAPVVQDVWAVQITASAASGTVDVTVNGKTVRATAADGVVNTTAALLSAALSASTEPEFAENTYTVLADTVTITGPADGAPTPTITKAQAGGVTATLTHAVTASGPNHWPAAANWDAGAVPVTGDSAYFTGASNVPCKYGLNQSGVTLALLQTSGYTGQIGLPDRNGSDQNGYTEPRDRYLAVGATVVNVGIGEQPGDGIGLLRLNTGSVQTALNVYNTGRPSGGDAAVYFKGTHASNALTWLGGAVAVASDPSEAATLGAVRGSAGNQGNPTLTFGPGCTLGTVDVSGGELSTESALGATTIEGGTLTLLGAAGIGATSVNGGSLVVVTSGTLGAVTVRAGGTLDYTRDQRTHTTGTITVYAGGTVDDSLNTLPSTTVISTPDGWENCTVKTGRGAAFTKN